MKCTELIEAAISIFDTKTSTFSRYANEKDWLQLRKAKWSSNKIRIGVIGVTSSGKSTLINAILSDSLLSMAVRPSSSQLVSCSKGNNSKAIISFKNSKDIVLEGDQLNLDNIKKYSDENVNRNNKENVTDIQLIASDFDLGEDVVLIDSAGLDAYKLESHEKLSLEVLLPTIDMCIFVTTLKTNSDEKTRMVLNTIAKHNCPLVIVQNMLDSVEPSVDGRKTKEMVALEHKNRLQRIIDASNIKDKASVRTIQVSAIYAMKSRCFHIKEERGSHYGEFIGIMQEMISEFIPKIDEERCHSFLNRYRLLIADEENNVSGKPLDKTKFAYEGLKGKLQRKFDSASKDLQREINKLITKQEQKAKQDNGGGFLGTLIGFLHTDEELTEENVDQKINDLKIMVKSCEETILKTITDFNRELYSIAKTMDIPLRDLVHFKQLETVAEPQIIQEDKLAQKMEKKSGVGNWLARGFGWLTGNDDWGYEEVSYTVKELNKTRTLEELEKYKKRAYRTYQQSINDWLKSIKEPIQNIESEIDRSYDSFKQRQKQIAEIADVKWVIAELKKLILTISLDTNKDATKKSKVVEKREEQIPLTQVRLSGYQAGLIEISRKLLYSVAQRTLIQGMKTIEAPNKAVIIGWDRDCIQSFLLRYFSSDLSDKSIAELEKSGMARVDEIRCLLNPEYTHAGRLLKEETPTSYFIMVNAQQDGSAKNQISKLNLKENIRAGNRIFFVVQDFDSLVNSDGIQEMSANLVEYYEEFGIRDQKGFLLINDDNPIYNLAYIQKQLSPCETIAEEQDLLKELQNRFAYLFDSKVSAAVADLIRKEGKGHQYA